MNREQLETQTKAQLLEIAPEGTSKRLLKAQIVDVILEAQGSVPEVQPVVKSKPQEGGSTPDTQPVVEREISEPPDEEDLEELANMPWHEALARVIMRFPLEAVQTLYREACAKPVRAKHSREFLELAICRHCEDAETAQRIGELLNSMGNHADGETP